MFAKLARNLFNCVRPLPRRVATATALFGYTLYNSHIVLAQEEKIDHRSQLEIERDQIIKTYEDYLKEIQQVQVCESRQIPEGGRKIVTVKDHEGKDRKIIIIRSKSKLYGFHGSCPYREPFDKEDADYSLDDAVCFNDKLYCPHHGCVFDIKSGSIEHGPALLNLPIFMTDERTTTIKLIYPRAIPTGIQPDYLTRDPEDLRKVTILGGDDSATVGCINSLRQFGFDGQITVVKEGAAIYPYRKEYLHKAILNLHLDGSQEVQKTVTKREEKSQKDMTKVPLKKVSQSPLDKYIQAQLQQHVYKKLAYFKEDWYDYYGIDFLFTDEAYRIINKRFYPYITFSDGTKLQFDGLMIATGLTQKLPTIQNLTVKNQKDYSIKLAENVFCPLRCRTQHEKLTKFLNKNTIKSLLVIGYNIESLEFIETLHREFPEIKVTVIDSQKNSAVSQLVGPQIQKSLAQEFTSRGVQFYLKVRDDMIASNNFNLKKVEQKRIQLAKAKDKNKELTAFFEDKNRYQNSVTVRISDDVRIKSDGVVIFPHYFAGNTEFVKNGKYTDFEFKHDDRLVADYFCRTDNIRIFSAGSSSLNDYFMSGKKVSSSNPLLGYEQGFISGLNIQALRIPMAYVPIEYHNFFGKRLIYLGNRQFFDSLVVIGSVADWDFVALYASGNFINGASGSASRSRQLNILRQAIRINCLPFFSDVVTGYWTIDNLEKLIRKLDQSGCYRDLIYRNLENINKKDLIWMQRTADAGFQNDRPAAAEDYPSTEVGDDGKLKEL